MERHKTQAVRTMSFTRLNWLWGLPKPGANLPLVLREITANQRQIKRAENRSVRFTLKQEPETLFEQLFGRLAFRQALKIRFRHPHAMMGRDCALHADHP